jgi:hypothetical protein
MSASDVASSLPIPESLLPYLTGELHDYSSLQDSIYKFNITFGILVLVTLALRMYVRMYIIRAAGLDDGTPEYLKHFTWPSLISYVSQFLWSWLSYLHWCSSLPAWLERMTDSESTYGIWTQIFSTFPVKLRV